MDFRIGLFLILVFNNKQKTTVMLNLILSFFEIRNIMKNKSTWNPLKDVWI
jgi:hypothetical protein